MLTGNMSEKGDKLRSLMSERLTAAAEEIFSLFERTIVEYEEELSRSKDENQRKQQLLDSLLNPQIRLHRSDLSDVENDREKQLTPETVLDLDSPSKIDVQIQTGGSEKESALIKQEPAFEVAETSVQNEEPHFDPQENLNLSLDKQSENMFLLKTRKTVRVRRSPRDNKGKLEKVLQSLRKKARIESRVKRKLVVQNADDALTTNRAPKAKKPKATVVNTAVVSNASKTKAKQTKKATTQNIKTNENSADICANNVQTGNNSSTLLSVNNSSPSPALNGTDIKRKSGEKGFRCDKCDNVFRSKQNFTRHIAKHTSWKVPNVSHLKKQPDTKLVHCPLCKEGFKLKKELKIHMKSHAKPFGCHFCTKRYTTEEALSLHVVNHTGMALFSCPVCQKGFMKRLEFKRHKRSHPELFPKFCPECNKVFCRADYMRQHLKFKHGKETYEKQDEVLGSLEN
ncbi:hypothetical protein WMY93_024758 [Mugilogobius chulae]|uniref:C2H2-type domain-containing protein n=1 Tax=Mugilogobius chulae TaxID=88201 RepID=A0AAW0N3U0_9GOBI